MGPIMSQITSLTIVYSIVYSDADQRKHQSSASLAFVWGIHRDRWIPRTNGQLRGKCFHLMTSSCVVVDHSIGCKHYSEDIITAMASQITSVSIVCSTVCSGADQRNIKARVTDLYAGNWIPLTKGQERGKMFTFDDIIMQWILFLGQWGPPCLAPALIPGLMTGLMASIVESLGDYHACAKVAGVPAPPTFAINRGKFDDIAISRELFRCQCKISDWFQWAQMASNVGLWGFYFSAM